MVYYSKARFQGYKMSDERELVNECIKRYGHLKEGNFIDISKFLSFCGFIFFQMAISFSVSIQKFSFTTHFVALETGFRMVYHMPPSTYSIFVGTSRFFVRNQNKPTSHYFYFSFSIYLRVNRGRRAQKTHQICDSDYKN